MKVLRWSQVMALIEKELDELCGSSIEDCETLANLLEAAMGWKIHCIERQEDRVLFVIEK